ncbi:type II toxin-antitoxin system RelB/DinJ family antitoxin [Rothia nasimurium]|uniref:type II toxin-antitoxin system RelB/DinJ family antitoxin n=1 Tax=Rothia nasimurium TaxID=85336 RepID=UPI001ADD6E9C
MTTSTVTVRVDEATKREAARIAEDFGLDLSSITHAFYRQVVREQRIPLTLEYPNPTQKPKRPFLIRLRWKRRVPVDLRMPRICLMT